MARLLATADQQSLILLFLSKTDASQLPDSKTIIFNLDDTPGNV
jgi:hypothetical protein